MAPLTNLAHPESTATLSNAVLHYLIGLSLSKLVRWVSRCSFVKNAQCFFDHLYVNNARLGVCFGATQNKWSCIIYYMPSVMYATLIENDIHQLMISIEHGPSKINDCRTKNNGQRQSKSVLHRTSFIHQTPIL